MLFSLFRYLALWVCISISLTSVNMPCYCALDNTENLPINNIWTLSQNLGRPKLPEPHQENLKTLF